VPEVLVGGNHEEIARWRREQSYLNTRQRRADLLNPTNSNPTDQDTTNQKE
jgi:tRNA (guanine37-N1)-methyltransferase